MNRFFFFILLLLAFTGQAQHEFSGSLSALGIGSTKSTNAFWLYSNQYGRIDKNTDYLGLGNITYKYSPNEDNQLTLGGGLLLANGFDDKLHLDELYARYRFSNVRATVGARHRDIKFDGLSSVGGDILWSGNAPAVPGVLLELVQPIKILNGFHLDASLGHYFLSDDRFVDKPQVHFKDIQLLLDLGPRDVFSFKLTHYAQFGGTSPVFGKQPASFSDYLRIFIGGKGGSESRATDQQNALGNHIGSYELMYSMDRNQFKLRLYHQSIFEDTSGRELRNFPDGVWGVFWHNKKDSFFHSLLYEYVQTVSQSGRFGTPPEGTFRGNDNYFSNGVYRSGWTYKSRIIGLPFVIPENDGVGIKINRFYVHHLGIAGGFKKFDFTLKGSYVKNLGTYNKPLPKTENAFYCFLETRYTTGFGIFNLLLGADYSDQQPSLLSAGLGYSIGF